MIFTIAPPKKSKPIPRKEEPSEKKICWLLIPKRRQAPTPKRKNHAAILTPL